jgi:hypothetical protein
MKLGIAGVVLVGMSSVVGCAGGEVGVHSQTARQIPPPIGRACASDWKTLATASEAYFANTGAYPVGQADLVDAGLLYEAIDGFKLTNVGSDYVLTAVGDCSGFEPG